MTCPFNDEQVVQLKAFVEICKAQPMLLHHPKLAFFKDYLASLGVTLPSATFGAQKSAPSGDSSASNNNADKAATSEEEDDTESDVELDMDGVIEADQLDDSQVMGGIDKEPSDEERDKSDEKRSEAMQAFSEQKFDEAIKLYTEAILINPSSALLFAKRAQAYLKLNKPNACIKDCTRALELNCDSAAAYKFRGRAYRLLGQFEEASHDLCESLKIDYDDQTNEWLNEVKPNAEKLRQHKLSMQRKKEEKEHRAKIRRARAAQEARAAAARAQADAPPAGFGGMGGGAGGFGGMGGGGGGGFNASEFGNLLFDQEIMAAFQVRDSSRSGAGAEEIYKPIWFAYAYMDSFLSEGLTVKKTTDSLNQDPEVAAAFQDVSSNPGNFAKYQSNPKVAAVIEKLQSKLGKGGAGGFPGGFPGFGGAGAPGGGKASDDDVGLD